MKVIAEIKEQDVNPEAPIVDSSDFDHRQAMRAIVINDLRQAVLLKYLSVNSTSCQVGGIESDENKAEAFSTRSIGRDWLRNKNCCRTW
ncbi:MAG TPA: hypothetical protein VFT87_05185 [Candidatus Saccharimonadales bacterium]|nr:hypothetical protein [Candidatus Saccharimonadales bacterium]